MKLLNEQTIWGMKIAYLQEQCKRYKFYSFLLILGYSLFFIILCFALYIKGTSVQSFVLLMLLFAFVGNYIYEKVLNPYKWQLYKFYLKHKEHTIVHKSYNLEAKTLNSILYCLGCKRLKDNKSFDDYKELVLSTIYEDNIYAKKIMKYLSNYEADDGNCQCSILVVKNKLYFIDFIEEK